MATFSAIYIYYVGIIDPRRKVLLYPVGNPRVPIGEIVRQGVRPVKCAGGDARGRVAPTEVGWASTL